MATPREHIEEIRNTKFKDNPLTEELHQAVKLLSAELYSKDVHFVMELIQNAEDNSYAPDVEPSLDFVFTTKDVAGVGATATLLVLNNEIGFQKRNIDSICSIGRSTKKNRLEGGYIGEKGIGFKSVFLVTCQPYIFSNGYKIRFSEVPPADFDIGYIVPKWVECRPSISELEEFCDGKIPSTVMVLPLRAEKVEAVQKELSSIQPEILLFMSKIKKLSVREVHANATFNKINGICVSRKTKFRNSKSEGSESFTLHLSAAEGKRSMGQSSYYMWRQRFNVKKECNVEQRKDVEKWVITLAFPCDKRLTKEDKPAPGIYSFLPTEMVTGFPFVIQADFLLVSSRETIIFDNEWNQGILGCIPLAFCSAFSSLVNANSPPESSCDYYKYLPADSPRYQQLAQVRDDIQVQLRMEEIVFCDSNFVGRDLGRPTETRRILPAFRSILERARQEGQQSGLDFFLAGDVKIVHPCLDKDEFSSVFKFLKVEYVSDEWYAGCIKSPGFLRGLSENLYVELLCFIAEKWKPKFCSHLQNTPFLKYKCSPSDTDFASMSNDKMGTRLYFSSDQWHMSWLSNWLEELQNAAQYYVMPESTYKAIIDLDGNKSEKLLQWLKDFPKITELSVSSFSKQLLEVVIASTSRKLVVNAALFFHFSCVNKFINVGDLSDLCSKVPIVDDRGNVRQRDVVKNLLVPASVSKWAKLMGRNLWIGPGFAALSDDYVTLPACARDFTGEGQDLVSFIKKQLVALDIPDLIFPPIAHLTFAFSPLANEIAFDLLEWLRNLYFKRQLSSIPRSVSEGKWIKTVKGFESPARSFLFHSERCFSSLVKHDVPCIDEAFYGEKIHDFKDVLEQVGVITKVGEGCDVIVDHHIRVHTDLKAITRLYKYLMASNWEPHGSKELLIWVPTERKWMSAKSCVIHDIDGLFKLRLKVLDNWYDDQLLEFFSNSLGVPSYPGIHDYCWLWQYWADRDYHEITESECCLVWKHIVQNWSSSSSSSPVKQYLGTSCKVPVRTNNGNIQVSSLGQAFVPDDLQLKELFKGVAKFTWHPNPSQAQISLDILFSVYNNMGVRNISEAVNKTEICVSRRMSFQKLQSGEGLLGMGLFRILLAYLAKPSFKLLANKRHQLVKALIDCPVYGVAEPLRMEYSLLTDEIKKIEREAVVRWEKKPKRLLIHTPGRDNQKAKMFFANAFAEVISHGLLVEFPDLVEGLCDMIKLGYAFDFDLEAVDLMLQNKNLQLFMEDERFLSGSLSSKVA